MSPAEAFELLVAYTNKPGTVDALRIALGSDPRHEKIVEFGSWIAVNLADAYRPLNIEGRP